jgi:catechol 2,3-dioxygenase-like lactoylglutathione lyase family enzyme
MLRFDHVGVVVEDLDAAIVFFVDLGFELEGRGHVSGTAIDKINGLDDVRTEFAMVRTPDRTGKLELLKYHVPADTDGPHALAANRFGLRHICLEVEDLDLQLDRLRGKGFDLVGEVADYVYRLCYVRGPEGLIIELAQAPAAAAAG